MDSFFFTLSLRSYGKTLKVQYRAFSGNQYQDHTQYRQKILHFQRKINHLAKIHRFALIWNEPVDLRIPTRRGFLQASALLFAGTAAAQVIEYEINGIKYQTLTRKGLTIIVTHMPNHIAGFGLLQVSIANGSDHYWTVKPEDFAYIHQESAVSALPADQVVDLLLDRASHGDVVKLVSSYENALYGIPHMRSTNGYEQRRQGAMSYGMPAKLKAAAMASAIALTKVRLAAGQSTDGAVFIPLGHEGRSLTGGHVVVHCEGETFDFSPNPT